MRRHGLLPAVWQATARTRRSRPGRPPGLRVGPPPRRNWPRLARAGGFPLPPSLRACAASRRPRSPIGTEPWFAEPPSVAARSRAVRVPCYRPSPRVRCKKSGPIPPPPSPAGRPQRRRDPRSTDGTGREPARRRRCRPPGNRFDECWRGADTICGIACQGRIKGRRRVGPAVFAGCILTAAVLRFCLGTPPRPTHHEDGMAKKRTAPPQPAPPAPERPGVTSDRFDRLVRLLHLVAERPLPREA